MDESDPVDPNLYDFDEDIAFEQGDDLSNDEDEENYGCAPGSVEFGQISRVFPPCPRRTHFGERADMHWRASLRSFGTNPTLATNYDYFMHFFDRDFFVNVLLACTQAAAPSLQITEDELWTFLAIRMIISCHPYVAVPEFFSLHQRTVLKSAPYLGDYMKALRFNQINEALRTAPPSDGGRPDKFYLVRPMLESWQRHQNTYGIIPSYICCTDESMMEWLNKRAPGWQFVHRKPMPWGNLFHVCACASSCIIFSLELFEGRDRPPWKPMEEFEDLFNTNSANKTKVGGLILRMAKPLFNTGSIVVHDSGFQCIPALKELSKNGVFASMLCKKKRYHPRFTDGAANSAFLAQQDFLVSFHKRMQFEDFNWQMNMYRDTHHHVQLASSYGSGEEADRERIRFHPINGSKLKFKHVDAVEDYFFARSAVDEHNKIRQGGISFEQGWQTKKWHIRMFAFLVGISETNAKNASSTFRDVPKGQSVSLLEFRLSIAQRLLDIHAAQKRAPARKAARELRDLNGEHHLTTIPVGCGRYTGKRDRDHIDGFKKLNSSRKSHAYQCQLCKCGKQIRQYCLCNPAQPLCIECYAEHRVLVATDMQ
jgi:hypothetical protein